MSLTIDASPEARLLKSAAAAVSRRITEGPEFNISSMLIQRETDLSRVLAWMLDPKGSHRARDAFLKAFVGMCGFQGISNYAAAKVRLEAPRYRANQSVGRVDIEINHPQFELLIENKPTAGFGDRQLQRYISSLTAGRRQGKLVVLLGAGWKRAVRDEIAETGTRVLRLGEDVVDWIAQCRQLTRPGSVSDFLAMLGRDLEERHSELGAVRMRELVDLMTETPETVAAAISIINAQADLFAAMTRRIGACIEERAKLANLGALRPVTGEHPLFAGNVYGILRLDIGDPRLDFAMQANSTSFRDVQMGVVTRVENRSLVKTYADQLALLQRSMEEDGGEPSDGWWLWSKSLSQFDVGADRGHDGPALWAWAADESNDGLAALFVEKALAAKAALETPLDS